MFFRRLHEERATGAASRYGERPSPRWDGGVDEAGRRHGSVWPRVARAARQCGAPLREFLAAQFRDGSEAPWPNQCHGAEAARRYGARRDGVAARAAARLVAEHRQFLCECAREKLLFGGSEGAAAARAIWNPRAALSPLYRYCVARRVGDEALAERFREEAALQCLVGGADGYRKGWAEMLPRGFLEQVEGFCGEEAPRAW